MAATRRSQLLIGEVARPHGLRGAVVVTLFSSEHDRLAVGSRLSTDDGSLVVRTARPLKERYVVEFEGVSSTEAAEALRGTALYAAPVEREGALWVDELIGAHVRTVAGEELGTIESVEANPASDLLVLDTGTLVPSRFVVGGVLDGTVVVDVPEGLVEADD